MNKTVTRWDFKTPRGLVSAEVRAKGAPGGVKFVATVEASSHGAGIALEDADINALFLSMQEAVLSASVDGWEKKIYVRFHGGERTGAFGEFYKDRASINRAEGTAVEIRFSYGIVEVAVCKAGTLCRGVGKLRSERIESFAREHDGGSFILLDYTDARFEALALLAERFGVLTDELSKYFQPEKLDTLLFAGRLPCLPENTNQRASG